MKAIKAIGFYIASFTWGLPMTLVGCIVALCLLIAGCKPHRFHHFIYFEVGEFWGGFECGCFFVVNKGATLALKQHEAGAWSTEHYARFLYAVHREYSIRSTLLVSRIPCA